MVYLVSRERSVTEAARLYEGIRAALLGEDWRWAVTSVTELGNSGQALSGVASSGAILAV